MEIEKTKALESALASIEKAFGPGSIMKMGEAQAKLNVAVSDLPPLPEPLVLKLRKHSWRRAFWYGGK